MNKLFNRYFLRNHTKEPMLKSVNDNEKNRPIKQHENLKIKASTLSRLIIIITFLLGLILTFISSYISSKIRLFPSEVSNVFNSIGVGLISASSISLLLDKIWNIIRKEEMKSVIEPIMQKMGDVNKTFEKLDGRVGAFKEVGLNFCHGNRKESLSRFYKMAYDGILNAKEKDSKISIKIVASSARGLVGFFDREVDDEIQYKWRDLIDKNSNSFQILLTHPAYAHLRQPAEERSNGAIETEILKSALHFLLVADMKSDHLRFFRGSPTVFMIQIEKEILINPYPYGNMAMKTVCLEFTGEENSFISQFAKSHFDHTWAFLDQDDKIIDGKPFVVDIKSHDSILEALKECTYLGNEKRLRLTEPQVKSLNTFIERKIIPVLEKGNADEKKRAGEIKKWGSFAVKLRDAGFTFCMDECVNGCKI